MDAFFAHVAKEKPELTFDAKEYELSKKLYLISSVAYYIKLNSKII